MPFVARSVSVIRDALLSYWSARYLAATGLPLLTVQGSDAYMEAEAVALIFAGSEQRGLTTTQEIFPDTASDESVLHHATVDGITRKAATSSVLQLSIVGGTALAVVTFGTATPRSGSGLIFTPSANADGTGASITLDGSGNGTFYGTCTTTGTGGNLAVGTVLTWSSPPAGSTPTVNVTAINRAGVDIETISALAQRILARRRERPGGGNRADWRSWAEEVSGVAEGYVYPLLHKTLGVGIPGAVTVIPLGLAPDPPSTGTTTRVLAAGTINAVAGYIEGTNDSLGGTTLTSEIQQRRPCVIRADDYSVEGPSTVVQDVLMSVTEGAGSPSPFPGTFTTAALCTTTVIKLTADPSGIIHNGDTVAIFDASASPVRGQYLLRTVKAGTIAPSQFEVTVALPTAPGAGTTVYPAPSNWTAMLDAVLSVIDRLGPGDPGGVSARYPTPSEIGPTTLYRSALVAAVMGVPGLPGALPGVSGVVSATCTTPAADVPETSKQLIIPGKVAFVF